MKLLTIQILEFVRSNPAHRMPILFTQGECPLPDCSESPAEVFQEVLRMEKEGLIEAHVNRDVKSNPKEIEVQYVTIAGAINLESKGPKARERTPSGRSLALATWSL